MEATMAAAPLTEFQKLMSHLLRARFPYTYTPTWEEERALSVIRGLVKDDTKTPLKALEFIERFEEPAVFVLHDFHI